MKLVIPPGTLVDISGDKSAQDGWASKTLAHAGPAGGDSGTAVLLRLGHSTATQDPVTYTVTGDVAVKVVPYSMHSMQPQLLAPAQHPQEQ